MRLPRRFAPRNDTWTKLTHHFVPRNDNCLRLFRFAPRNDIKKTIYTPFINERLIFTLLTMTLCFLSWL